MRILYAKHLYVKASTVPFGIENGSLSQIPALTGKLETESRTTNDHRMTTE